MWLILKLTQLWNFHDVTFYDSFMIYGIFVINELMKNNESKQTAPSSSYRTTITHQVALVQWRSQSLAQKRVSSGVHCCRRSLPPPPPPPPPLAAGGTSELWKHEELNRLLLLVALSGEEEFVKKENVSDDEEEDEDAELCLKFSCFNIIFFHSLKVSALNLFFKDRSLKGSENHFIDSIHI